MSSPRNTLWALLVAVLVAGLLSVPSAAAAGSKPSRADLRERADYWVEKATVASVQRFQKRPPKLVADAYLNWTTDGCSVPGGEKTTKYERWFTPSCDRHDFGYRNFGKARSSSLALRPTRAQKDKIDTKFKSDMLKFCSDPPPSFPFTKTGCKAHAHTFYQAVSRYGDGSFFG